VVGKEFSDTLDRDIMGLLDTGQTIAWDGVGGTMDGLDYTGIGPTFAPMEVDAMANHLDALYFALRGDASFLLFSVGNGSAPLFSGMLPTSEGETIGFAGDVSFERPGAISKGIWAPGPSIDSMVAPADVDGLEVWGPEPPGFDSDRFSYLADAASGVSVWNATTGGPYIAHATIAAAVTALLGPIPPGVEPDDLDLDGLMVQDVDGVPDEFGGLGDSIIFSIRQMRDAMDPDGFYATGSEIFTLDAAAVGLIPGFLFHGGHLWDHPYSLAAMKTADGRQLDINALEGASVPEPSAWVLCVVGLLAGWRPRSNRQIR
jgi:hypothetical protein